MQAKRFDEYHKNGCNFFGKLVVVDYCVDMEKDPRWGQFASGIVYKYIERAEAMVTEHYGKPKRVLLTMPDYVVEFE